MRIYNVWVADRFTKMPLASYKVEALCKWHAKRIVFKALDKDKSFLIIVSKWEE